MHTLKNIIYKYYENVVFTCLLLYGLTFLIDIKINFLTTAFVFNIIFCIFLQKKQPLCLNYTNEFKYFIITVIFFFILTCLSTIIAGGSLSEYKSRLISPILGLLIFLILPVNKKRILLLFLSFAIPLSINALFVIYQFYQGDLGRPTGFSNHHYMMLAVTNTLILPIMLSLGLHKSQLFPKLKILFLLLFLVNVPAIIFENTRIIWIELAIILPFIILSCIKSKIKAFSAIILLLICIVSFFAISPSSINRFSGISDTDYKNQSNYERILMWQSASEMFMDYPIAGVGIGNYHEQYMNNYRSPLSREDQAHPHNVLLTFLSETGILGTLGYLLLFIYLYYYTIKNYIVKKDVFSLAFLSCLLAFSINSLTDSIFCQIGYKGNTSLFWIITTMYFILNNHLITFKQKD